MNFLSLSFFALVIGLLIVYYLVPLKWRYVVLLAGSCIFYYFAWKTGWYVILITAVTAYLAGLLIRKTKHKKLVSAISIILVLMPWLFTKGVIGYFFDTPLELIVPMGISFYTLGLISYLADVCGGKIEAEKNPFKFLLFVTYFPQILQGPIPRYDKLEPQFTNPARWEEQPFMEGALSVAWGFFLKLVIADRLVVMVDPIFASDTEYRGAWVVIGIVLYIIQLYADFMGCFSISKGVSLLFGIRIQENFNQPFFSRSIKEFWTRWHISLGLWLRDYVYIPLGGNRKGKVHKMINLTITFLASALWHGVVVRYLLWGLLQMGYQMVEDVVYKTKFFSKRDAFVDNLRRFITTVLFLISLIVFKAPSTMTGFYMLKSVLTTANYRILTDGSMLSLGISFKSWIVLGIAFVILVTASILKEKGIDIKKKILSLPLPLRWTFYLVVIFVVMTFGAYGNGFDSQAFVYGGF